jgi:FixJ family two-component response regulator
MNGSPKKPLISIIDDDEPYREATAGLIKSLGFAVAAFPSAEDFLKSSDLRNTCCLMTDINMKPMTGLELHDYLVRSGYAIPTILITAYPDETARARALAHGVICYLSKPCNEDALIECVRSALKVSKL